MPVTPILLCVAYRRPASTVAEFNSILDSITLGIQASLTEGKEAIISGDFNAHHLSWDSASTPNHWGNRLFTCFTSLGYRNMNSLFAKDILTYRTASESRKSVVDLIFAAS